MDICKIKKFYEARACFMQKYKDIVDAMHVLDAMSISANKALADVVDSKLDLDTVNKMLCQYQLHKFNAPEVKSFLEYADELVFSKVDPIFKARMQVTSISASIQPSYDADGEHSQINAYVKMHVIDESSDRAFSVKIPVESFMRVDVLNWESSGAGMYIVDACNGGVTKTICKCFNRDLISTAVNKFFSGEFDKSLSYSVSCNDDVRDYVWYDNSLPIWCNAFTRSAYARDRSDDQASNCIDDTYDYSC